ncbi:hypothetical protein Acr_00g0096080 [Actinidia rufa]|uniref:Uncharacterized protein n=1 Tax=Actinidia rufa TaxID=165716 RepID=A0A7J0DYI5_9ERIC|nr:hypothetical protein Acr_00g0096080 [Actinidia rufa]
MLMWRNHGLSVGNQLMRFELFSLRSLSRSSGGGLTKLELLGRSEERSKICEQNVDQEEIEVNPELSEMVLGDKLIQSREIKMKKSSRTPKKRSIVEIFAVAPQVERVDDDDDDEEEVCSEEKETHNSKVLALADVVCYLESKGKTKKMMAKKKKPNLKDEAMRKLKKQKRMSKAKKNGLKKTEAMAYGLYLLCEIKGIEVQYIREKKLKNKAWGSHVGEVFSMVIRKECGAPASSAVRIGQ